MTTATTRKVKAKAKSKVAKAESTFENLTQSAMDTVEDIKGYDYSKALKEAVKDIDYKQLGKEALKIALPIVVMKLIHSKMSTSKKFEEACESFMCDVKDIVKKHTPGK